MNLSVLFCQSHPVYMHERDDFDFESNDDVHQSINFFHRIQVAFSLFYLTPVKQTYPTSSFFFLTFCVVMSSLSHPHFTMCFMMCPILCSLFKFRAQDDCMGSNHLNSAKEATEICRIAHL
jgi:hypothetical protein